MPQRTKKHIPFYTCARGVADSGAAGLQTTDDRIDLMTQGAAQPGQHNPFLNKYVYVIQDKVTLECYEYETYNDYYGAEN